jgi:hypothetical protein
MAKDPAARYRSAGDLARVCARTLGIALADVELGRDKPEPSPEGKGSTHGGSAPTVVSE